MMFLVGATIFATPAIAFQSQSEGASDGTETTFTTNIVCRRYPAPTGTRIGTRRVCKTQFEWDAIDQDARNAMEEAGNRNRFGNCTDPDQLAAC